MREIVLIWFSLFIFGAIHSLLASRGAKSFGALVVGKRTQRGLYRAAYNIVAVISFAPTLLLVVGLPDRELYGIPEPLSCIALAVQGLAALGLIYSAWQMDVFHFSGLKQLAAWLGGGEAHSASDTSASHLVVDGLHRYVRHPLYTTSLIVLWLVSPMTINRLAFLIGVTIYFYVGSIFEEHKLVAEFGEAYRAYQRRVPRLIPGLRSMTNPRHSATRASDEGRE